MFISLDLETTGFDAENDEIIEFGAIKFDLSGHSETMQCLFNPGIPIPEIVTHITKITDSDVTDAPDFASKMSEIQEFIGDLPIIGHNIQFDTGFLRAKGIPLTNPEYDTCQLASILMPGLPSYSLEVIAAQLKLQHAEAHRALDDSIAAQELFLKLIKIFQTLPSETHTEIVEFLKRSDWPLKDLLTTLPSLPSEATPTTKNETKVPPTPTNSEKILTKKSTLFQISPPYDGLISFLSEKISPDSYLSMPRKLFRRVERQIPDTIAKIDTAESYISPKRLTEFSQKTHFENHEVTALIKYHIWHKQTDTGLLSELKLLGKEKQTLHKVQIDPNIHPLESEEFYQKALKKNDKAPAICTHDYILSKPDQNFTELLIVDFEDFTKKIFWQQCQQLNSGYVIERLESLQAIHPDNSEIPKLIDKTTIIFGLAGILFDKFNDGNAYNPRLMISNLEVVSKEWTDIKAAIQNLIEISKELAPIVNDKTLTELQHWKKFLTAFHNIFTSPELETSLVWIEKDHKENIVIRKAPTSTTKELKQILERCESYKIIGQNIDISDQGTFIKKLHKLPEDLAFQDLNDRSEKAIVEIIADVDDKDPQDRALIKDITAKLTDLKGKTAVILNSRKKLEQFTVTITKSLKEVGLRTVSQLTGSMGKITSQFQEYPEESTIFMTPNYWNMFPHPELIDTLIIHKIPFAPPSDTWITAMSDKYRNAFIQLQIPLATFALQRMIDRLGPKHVIITDPRLVTKDYGKQILTHLERIANVKTSSTLS